MPPTWLQVVAVVSIVVAVLCAIVIVADIRLLGYRQRMTIMEWVWPITALYMGLFGLAFYLWAGRASSEQWVEQHGPRPLPHWVRVGVSTTHCGAGCTLGDVIAETIIVTLGLTLFGATIWASFVLDFTLALALGIIFQFAAIRAMSSERTRVLLGRAAKADVWSLTAFEIGLFGWMALMWWVFFPDPHLSATSVTFWFLMQVGMTIGFVTSYPMNALLISRGVKEAM